MPDFWDFLYFVREQGLKTPFVTQSCNIAVTPSQATPMASHGRAWQGKSLRPLKNDRIFYYFIVQKTR